AHPGIEAKRIVEHMAGVRPVNLSTIQTTLERLVRKGLLEREKRRYAFVYTASVSRAGMLGTLIKDVIHLLHDGKADTILSSFINVAANIDESGLDRMETMIQRKRLELEEE